MKKQILLTLGAAVALLSFMGSVPVRQTYAQESPSNDFQDFVPPIVFQAAGPTAASIQDMVDTYQEALGVLNNGNAPGPLDIDSGHREINWDGRDVVTNGPLFDGFLATRGALFTTPDGTAFTQATLAGLAGQFNNPSYETIFTAFSEPRLFSAIGSNITDVDFFVPGGSNAPATVTGFGAVFTDVDQPDGSGPGRKHGNRKASTLMEFFGSDGRRLFSSFIPAAPGDGSLSFLGIVFDDARIARVRITSGNVAPGPEDGGKRDIVMMEDFLYGEPQPSF
jgi:hypothetical protein